MHYSRHHMYPNTALQKQRGRKSVHNVYPYRQKTGSHRKLLSLENSNLSKYLSIGEHISRKPIAGIIAILIFCLVGMSGAFMFYIHQNNKRQHETIMELIHINAATNFPKKTSRDSNDLKQETRLNWQNNIK